VKPVAVVDSTLSPKVEIVVSCTGRERVWLVGDATFGNPDELAGPVRHRDAGARIATARKQTGENEPSDEGAT